MAGHDNTFHPNHLERERIEINAFKRADCVIYCQQQLIAGAIRHIETLRIQASFAQNQIAAVAVIPYGEVVATTFNIVVATAASDAVITSAANQLVIIVAANQPIIANAADCEITPGAAVENQVCRRAAADQRIVAFASGKGDKLNRRPGQVVDHKVVVTAISSNPQCLNCINTKLKEAEI